MAGSYHTPALALDSPKSMRTSTRETEMANDDDQKKNKPFRLLDLPPELWSRICKSTVKHEGPISIWAIKPQPPITRVCRAIRAECLPYYYSANLFYDHDPVLIAKWLRRIGKHSRNSLRRLYRGPMGHRLRIEDHARGWEDVEFLEPVDLEILQAHVLAILGAERFSKTWGKFKWYRLVCSAPEQLEGVTHRS